MNELRDFRTCFKYFLTALDNENWQKLEADQTGYSLCTLTSEIYNSNVSMLRLETKGCRVFFFWFVFTLQSKR